MIKPPLVMGPLKVHPPMSAVHQAFFIDRNAKALIPRGTPNERAVRYWEEENGLTPRREL